MLLIYYFLIAILGASWGSFLLVVYERRLAGISIAFPRSYCPSCANTLPYYCLFPIFSYWISHGHCIFCSSKIPIYSFGIEILAAISFLRLEPIAFQTSSKFIFLLLLSFLAVEDLAIQKISTPILILPALIFVFFNFSWFLFLILSILLYFILNNFEHLTPFQKIGQGDIEVLLFSIIAIGMNGTANVTLLASILGITKIILSKNKVIPFIPYYLIAYFLIMFEF